MEIQADDKIEIDGIVIGPGMTEEQAKLLATKGAEVTAFVMMTLAKMLAAQTASSSDAPSTPSGAKPVYTKPNKQDQRRGGKKKGAKVGHEGVHRATPVEIDRRETRRATACPDCGYKRLRRRSKTRKRVVIDIPESFTAEAVEYTIHLDYCPKCKKEVEPKIPEALPGSTLGNRIVAFTAWLHYCLNMTIGQLVSVFEFHIKSTISRGGLMKMWHRLAAIFEPWYDQIEEDAKSSAVLHGDETGWRVDGRTHWLWCFASEDTTYYMVHQSRGSPAIAEFFKEFYDGVLVTDFWAAYNRVACADRQMCLAHLLRELKKVDKYLDTSEDWQAFRKKLKRLVQDAIRLCHRRDELSAEKYMSLKNRIDERLDKMLSDDWANKNATRLVKRLRKYRPYIFTFLENASVPYENNFAEREVRPAVLHRKNSYGNRSNDGAQTQSVLMSIFRTLKQRNLNPIDMIVAALREYCQTGKLPQLPQSKT
jgi:DNA-directed RNA polymerase subunit RPC12/RpoP